MKRKSGRCTTRRMTITERHKYSNPALYGRQHDPAEGEFDKDKHVNLAQHIEDLKEDIQAGL